MSINNSLCTGIEHFLELQSADCRIFGVKVMTLSQIVLKFSFTIRKKMIENIKFVASSATSTRSNIA